jgi:hypothetical protein
MLTDSHLLGMTARAGRGRSLYQRPNVSEVGAPIGAELRASHGTGSRRTGLSLPLLALSGHLRLVPEMPAWDEKQVRHSTHC